MHLWHSVACVTGGWGSCMCSAAADGVCCLPCMCKESERSAPPRPAYHALCVTVLHSLLIVWLGSRPQICKPNHAAYRVYNLFWYQATTFVLCCNLRIRTFPSSFPLSPSLHSPLAPVPLDLSSSAPVAHAVLAAEVVVDHHGGTQHKGSRQLHDQGSHSYDLQGAARVRHPDADLHECGMPCARHKRLCSPDVKPTAGPAVSSRRQDRFACWDHALRANRPSVDVPQQ